MVHAVVPQAGWRIDLRVARCENGCGSWTPTS